MSDLPKEEHCTECGMFLKSASEYHPYAACLMFKQCADSATVNLNLEVVIAYALNYQRPNEPKAQQHVWIVSNRTTQVVFTTEAAATKFMSSFPGSVAGGFDIVRAEVLDMEKFVERAHSETGEPHQ